MSIVLQHSEPNSKYLVPGTTNGRRSHKIQEKIFFQIRLLRRMPSQELDQDSNENFAWYLHGGPSFLELGLVPPGLAAVLAPVVMFLVYLLISPIISSKKRKLTRLSSSIGRFSLRSQTRANPSIITFFIALANPPGEKEFDHNILNDLIKQRVLPRHERFGYCVDKDDDRFFEVCDIVNCSLLLVSLLTTQYLHPSDRKGCGRQYHRSSSCQQLAQQ